ncbi:hypothetical protein H8356DRAFT_1430603 [Neocallimastix lanati (nom. inval.)]|nr:hypothetical protein H8356DRAFT_1430603 [Neocallimastix sp. JGI-2020a]
MKINKINEKHLNFSCLSFKLLVGTITTDNVPNIDDLIILFSEEVNFFFVETRILQSDVKIVHENNLSNGGNFIGSILHPRARVNGQTLLIITFCDILKLRVVENKAMEKNFDFVLPGDIMVIQNHINNKERLLSIVEKNKINIVEEEIIKSAKNISHRKLSKYIHKFLIEIQDVKAIISAWRHGNITNYDE